MLPTSMVAIYSDELCVTIFSTPELNGEDCLSLSGRNLLAETKAISIPEKKAESKMAISIMVIKNILVYQG